ncbi:MAG: tetratricopeptide repeat protein [Deltaproteobacteria bacterium]|nr:tetratricopeptide repeat protein [Deltaproteobacteria bacterium]
MIRIDSDDVPHRPGESSNLAIWAAVLVAVVGLVYSNTLNVPFLHDDFANIVENPGIRRIFPLFGAADATGFINRPVIRLSFAVNYALGGESVTGYHLLNILIHAASALALFALVRLTLSMSPAFGSRLRAHATPLAFFAALLWGVHPLNTQAVTYLSQRCESMAGFFYITTLYGAALASLGKRPLWGWMVAIPAFFLGLGTKEILVTAPVVVAAWQFLFAPRPFKSALWRSAPVYAAFFAGVLILAYSLISSETKFYKSAYAYDLNRLNYAMTQPAVLVHYLKLAFWPRPLVFDYWWPIEKGLGFIPYALVLGAGFIATVWGLFKRHPASFAGVCFFSILAPSSSIVALTTTAAEYRMYLPLAAICSSLAVMLGVFAINRGRKALPALGIFAAILAIALAAASFTRNLDYRDAYTLWNDTVAKRPQNPRAREGLGLAISMKGDYFGAIDQFREIITIDKNFTSAYYNIGRLLLMQNRPQEALKYYLDAVRLAPHHWMTWKGLGVAQCRNGLFDEGILSLRKARRINPNDETLNLYLESVLKSRQAEYWKP